MLYLCLLVVGVAAGPAAFPQPASTLLNRPGRIEPETSEGGLSSLGSAHNTTARNSNLHYRETAVSKIPAFFWGKSPNAHYAPC